MSYELNPYNCTKPGNLFSGYERLRDEIYSGFRNGNSFAILGGRRCGKTSLLLQIKKELSQNILSSYTAVPCLFSMQEFNKINVEMLFKKIFQLIVHGIETPKWEDGCTGNEYQYFLNRLEIAEQNLINYYGDNWLIVLLIDELDSASAKLPDDSFFQNLRNLHMDSKFHSHFRMIATGVKEMAKLINTGSSPLNNLRNKYLGILPKTVSQNIVEVGFSDFSYHPIFLDFLFNLTGRHPFILQGILEKLWESKNCDWDKKIIQKATNDFIKEQSVFNRWTQGFDPIENIAFRLLAEHPLGKLNINEIRSKVDDSLKDQIGTALTVLSYHGVIDDSDDIDEPQISGTIFRDWFIKNTIDYSNNQKKAIVLSIINNMQNEIGSSEIDLQTKNNILSIISKLIEKPEKEAVKSSIEEITNTLKKANTNMELINKIVGNAQRLGPYIGTASGWIYALLV